MAESKNEKNVDEDILRFIFNSKFFPETEENPFDMESPVIDLISKSRDYKSARNILLDAATKDPNILNELRTIADFYAGSYKKSDDSWTPQNTFVGDLSKSLKSINVEDLPIQDVIGESELIADVLGYNGGWNTMYSSMPDFYKFGNNRKSIRNFIKDKVNERISGDDADANEIERNILKYRLGLSNNSDDDYMLDKMSDYIARAVTYELNNEHKKEHPYGHAIDDFVAPNSYKKADEGLPAKPIDILADLSQWGVGFGAMNKALKAREAAKAAGTLADRGVKPFVKPAAYAGASSGGLAFLHDLGDSLTTKHVYSEDEDGKEIVKRANAMDVLANTPKYIEQSLLGAALALPLMGASMGVSAIGKAGNVVKNKVGSAIDRLFGTKNSKSMMENVMNSKNAALERLEKNTESAMDKLFKNTTSNNNALKETYKKIDELESNPLLKTKGKSTEQQRNQINSKIDKAKREAESYERKIKSSDLERASINDYKNRATKHIIDNFDPMIAELDKEIATKDVLPNALFYLTASKDLANNVPEKRVSTNGMLRLLNASFGK